ATEGVRFPCKQCGANLEYEPGTKEMVCQYCGALNEIPESAELVREQDFRSAVAVLEENTDHHERRVFKCDACAAEIDAPPSVTAMDCPYCGFHLNITLLTKMQIKPQAVLPFALKGDQARDSFGQWLRRLWFAPNKLKDYARNDQKLTGMYVPYWTYDSKSTCSYTGKRGDDYWVTVGYGKNVRRERRTRWTFASGTVYNTFDDVLVLASKSLPPKLARELEPWDLPRVEPYQPEYVAGFLCESYQIGLAEGFGQAEQIMEERIRETICADIGGDHQQIDSMQPVFRDITFKHILLPIWISAYRYRDKVYRFLVNARTGEVQGERPWSAWKIAFASLAAVIVAIIIILIASRN
ncbi:MAG TPA: hypothetical protein VG711_13105, partial [Phycisphaerales bacterium]|nr:hypothetical protein [Phycisphaerales bacterium]